MGLLELFLLAVGLSMDAFAVSVCKGLSMKQMKWKYALRFLAITNIPLLIFSPMSSVIHVSASVIGFLSITIYKCFPTK